MKPLNNLWNNLIIILCCVDFNLENHKNLCLPKSFLLYFLILVRKGSNSHNNIRDVVLTLKPKSIFDNKKFKFLSVCP